MSSQLTFTGDCVPGFNGPQHGRRGLTPKSVIFNPMAVAIVSRFASMGVTSRSRSIGPRDVPATVSCPAASM